ncbi:MAG: response regulator [Opitutae bacterium]
MKRVLFVDDEVFVLDGLKRMLRRMRTQWEMDFVDSGESALQMMAQKEFDVIVSDMRMPNMNGAELLNEVKDLHPNTIRFILSGYSDKDLILKSLDSTHQYLAKPCDPETLKTRILRATSLQESISNDALKNLISQLGELPTLPALYEEILSLLRQPDVSSECLSDAIKKDIGMTAKILKFANSGYVGLKRKISGMNDAVSYLGMDYIRSIILTIGAFGRLKQFQIDGSTLEDFWGNSLMVAEAAKAITISQTSSRTMAEESYVGGLLHACGKLILSANFPSKYVEVNKMVEEDEMPLLDAEVKIFGAHHGQVGAFILGLWGLAGPIVEAVHWYRNPSNSIPVDFQPLTSVHVASSLIFEPDDEEEDLPSDRGLFNNAELDKDYLEKISLLNRLEDWRFLVNSYQRPNEDRQNLVSGILDT